MYHRRERNTDDMSADEVIDKSGPSIPCTTDSKLFNSPSASNLAGGDQLKASIIVMKAIGFNGRQRGATKALVHRDEPVRGSHQIL